MRVYCLDSETILSLGSGLFGRNKKERIDVVKTGYIYSLRSPVTDVLGILQFPLFRGVVDYIYTIIEFFNDSPRSRLIF